MKSQIGAQPVVLFMKGTPDFPQCGFSARTVAPLKAVEAEFPAKSIFGGNGAARCRAKRYSNWPTYPQLYVSGERVDGCGIALQV